MTINEILVSREISALVHFTRLDNLPSIMEHGIQPRAIIDDPNNQITGLTNDAIRVDGKTNASCLSISYPNCSMLYKLKKDNPETSWVVIAIKPEILLAKQCLFYPTNAACNQVRHLNASDFSGPAALSRMFDEKIVGKTVTTRSEHPYLLPRDPTDVQAEILAFGVIEPQFIIGCIFERESQRAEFSKNHSGFKSSTWKGWGVFDNRKQSRLNGYKGVAINRG